MKTVLDLHLSASAAAASSLNLPHKHAVSLFGHAAFEQDGCDPRDYDYWEATFINQRNSFLSFRAQKPRSVQEDEHAAAIKAAEEKAAKKSAPATPPPNAS